MSDQKKTGNQVGDEFIKLGENLRDVITSAWESEERKKVTDEVKTGLNQLVATFSQLADEFSRSETGQSIQAELDEFNERVKTGDIQNKISEDVVNVLQRVNDELRKAAGKWSHPSSGPSDGDDA